MKRRFLIDADAPPALGPVSTRYQWCCNNGCGQCEALLVEFRVTHCTVNGATEHEVTEPRMVSSCCGESMFLWDSIADNDGPPDFDGRLFTAAAKEGAQQG